MSSKKINTIPFLNFIRSYSTRHSKWPNTKVAVEGAKLWHAMCPTDRVRFIKQAEMAKKKQHVTVSILKKQKGSGKKSVSYGSGRHRRRRSKSRGRRRSKSRGRRSKGRRSRSRRRH